MLPQLILSGLLLVITDALPVRRNEIKSPLLKRYVKYYVVPDES